MCGYEMFVLLCLHITKQEKVQPLDLLLNIVFLEEHCLQNKSIANQKILATDWIHLGIPGALENDIYRRKYIMICCEEVTVKTGKPKHLDFQHYLQSLIINDWSFIVEMIFIKN